MNEIQNDIYPEVKTGERPQQLEGEQSRVRSFVESLKERVKKNSWKHQ